MSALLFTPIQRLSSSHSMNKITPRSHTTFVPSERSGVVRELSTLSTKTHRPWDSHPIFQYLFSFRTSVTVLLVSLVCLTSIIIWTVWFVLSLSSSLAQARVYMETIASKVTLNIDNTLSTTKKNAKVTQADWNLMFVSSLAQWKEVLCRNLVIFQNSMSCIGLGSEHYGTSQYYCCESTVNRNGVTSDMYYRVQSNDTYLYNYRIDETSGSIVSYENRNTYQLETRPWYTSGMAATAKEGVWGDIYVSTPSYVTSVVYVLPIYNLTTPEFDPTKASSGGKRIGVVKSALSLLFLSSFLNSQELPGRGLVVITESNGLLIASSLPSVSSNLKDERIHMGNVTTRGVSRIYQAFKSDKVTTLSVYKSVSVGVGAKYLVRSQPYTFDNMRWVVYTAMEQRMVYNSVIRSTYISAIIAVGIILVSTVLVFLAAYLVSKPLFDLSKKMEQVQQINFTEGRRQNNSFISEVRNLQNHYDKMETAIMGFLKYVPADVVRTFINQPKGSELFEPGVTEKNIAVMFTDIVGFTAIAEKISPTDLVEMITVYFETVTRVIFNHSGTLDKYIGDATMVLFNCPADVFDYEYLACACALEIQKELGVVNNHFESLEKPRFETRVGVNVGTCFVGNIGSSFRLSYTALGDVVNSASRLEALNRHYGTDIVISGECYNRVKDRFTCRLVDTVAVKGKSAVTKVYELIGHTAETPSEMLNFARLFTSMLENTFYQKKFEETIQVLENLQDPRGKDRCSKIIQHRCKEFIRNPPDAEWKGVHKLLSK